ncbi:class II aldolase/adducin family protein [Aneurinibacillus sp. Ricciae_BoGa-3]|uniref:class II aldolase/adducin family protein n=1 Tax=Aneurinibacillus sp. Ricciae_BoGa-3 TaxID=3022697 RepID=UPI00234047C1|nr:class II aldolase/adducin family protein [Aneurinibacillus sp. Ricciae_BoGa-3]WCK52324.1 class II aldolase/adducin family protein [Aneurinibacillus sp. Ricciae_BoGa-3]
MKTIDAISKLVLANKILSQEGILEAFGHVSMRNPENQDEFLLSCSRAPLLVSEDDIMRHNFDGDVLDKTYKPYAERILHGQIYKSRPDVQAICHNHAVSLLPFTTTGTEIKPVIHIGCMFYDGIPLYDDYDVSDGMLIKNANEGLRIARSLADKRALLLRGHGVIVVGGSIEEVVMGSIYLSINAEVQFQSMQLGTPKYLSYEEARAATEVMYSDFALKRAWDYWQARTNL